MVPEDRTGVVPATGKIKATGDGAGAVRSFMELHYRHFNARETLEAARAYETHIAEGGKMLLAMAGAMSTGQLGVSLARIIREGNVHAISCTGANLEEDLFNLLANKDYEIIHDWRALSAEDEQALHDRGMNRVTDTCIPEDVMRNLERRLIERWVAACEDGAQKTPSEYFFDVIGSGELEDDYQIDPANSWMIAAHEMDVPVWAPGWEDSSMGNVFAAKVIDGVIPHHQCVMSGTGQFEQLVRWYLENNGADEGRPSVGFFQIGGGIAGDFAICAVPSIIQDMKRDVPFWGYFAQITDAATSYGGYSGALPNEKITWGKLAVDTPKFFINSDASLVAPLIFAYILRD